MGEETSDFPIFVASLEMFPSFFFQWIIVT